MKVLVCGGRDYDDWHHVWMVLDEIDSNDENTLIVEGGAKGADEAARDWCRVHSCGIATVQADWNAHGRSAGPRRNRHMVECHPDIGLVVAFPGGAGTADMVRVATAKGIKVVRPIREADRDTGEQGGEQT